VRSKGAAIAASEDKGMILYKNLDDLEIKLDNEDVLITKKLAGQLDAYVRQYTYVLLFEG
jgi:hypothetical protein